MAISNKLEYLNDTKNLIKKGLNDLGANLTDDSTFRSYSDVLIDMYNNYPKVSGEDKILSLAPTKQGKLIIVPNGNSSQFSTTGKNLFNFVSETHSEGTSVTLDGNELNIEWASGFNCDLYNVVSNLDATKSYTVSFKHKGDSVKIRNIISGSENLLTTGINSNFTTCKITLTGITGFQFRIVRDTTNGTALIKDIQIELGSTATSYEPYTGGIPAPNPSYSYPVKSVIGENSLIIQNKNLFDKDAVVQNSMFSGDVGSIVSTSENANTFRIPIMSVENINNITISSKISAGVFRIRLLDENNIILSNTRYTSMPQTIDVSSCKKIAIFFDNTVVTINDDIQIEKGSQATSYVAHQEQLPYPISLGNMEFCSSPDGTIRDQIVGSSDVSYNLFDKDNANILNAYINGTNKKIEALGNTRTLYMPCKPNMTYTIQRISGQRFIAISSPDYEIGSIGTNIVQNNTGSSITITTGSSDKYLCVFYYHSSYDTATEQEVLDSIQITEGSEVKPYAPYGQVGMWWKREYIGKGDTQKLENIVEVASTTGNNLYVVACYAYGIAKAINSKGSVLSNILPPKILGSTSDTTNVDNVRFYQGIAKNTANNEQIIISVEKSYLSDTTIQALITFLTNNNFIFYYLLGTPIDVPITNATLVQQLNNIYNNAHSYNGATNITSTYASGNEQIVIKASALLKNQN